MTETTLFIMKCLGIYLLAVNLAAVIFTVSDKVKARKGAWRVPEKTLLGLGFIGGALGEWITMLIIRHKTKHMKFMILLPLFILLHAALAVWLLLI